MVCWRLLYVPFYPLQQLRKIHGAGLPRYFMPVIKQDKRWNTADSESFSRLLRHLGIQFRQPRTGFQLSGGLLIRRRHHFAGTAPGCPEIDHHRNIAAGQLLAEIAVIQLQGTTGKQPLLAFSA